MAALLMYHHLLPSPAFFFESQDAPGKLHVSLRMENGMVPVSPTGILYVNFVLCWKASAKQMIPISQQQNNLNTNTLI